MFVQILSYSFVFVKTFLSCLWNYGISGAGRAALMKKRVLTLLDCLQADPGMVNLSCQRFALKAFITWLED